MKQTQKQILLNLLKQNGRAGVNSYDADYIYHIKQAPTRIFELRQLGHSIVARTNKNKSVNWILTNYFETSQPTLEKTIEWEFDGNVARIKTQPKQEKLL